MKRSLLAASAALSLLALSACTVDSGSEGTSENGLADPATLTVCSDIPYEPFEFVEDGKNVGFDIDLAQKLADRMEVELNVITTAFEAIQSGSALDTAQCDIAFSGLSITDERKTKMDFSQKYLLDNLALVVTKDSGIESKDDLQGKEVGVQQATTGEAFAEDNGMVPKQYEDSGLLTQAISSGQINAAVANVSTIYAATQADDSLELVENYDTGEVIGAAVKKDNSALLEEFDTMLTEMYSDGSYDDLVDEWFGTVADAARVPEADRSGS